MTEKREKSSLGKYSGWGGLPKERKSKVQERKSQDFFDKILPSVSLAVSSHGHNTVVKRENLRRNDKTSSFSDFSS